MMLLLENPSYKREMELKTLVTNMKWSSNPSYKHEIELKTLVNGGTKLSPPFMNASGVPLLFAGAHR